MDMEERVENLLKIAKTHINGDNDYSGYEITGLKDNLMDLIQDTDLRKRLAVEWEKMLYEKRVETWDERFLKVVAGESNPRTTFLGTQRITMPITSNGTGGQTLAVPNGAGTGATWVSPTAIQEQEMKRLIEEVAKEKGLI